MQINHLPAVNTTCCSAMPFISLRSWFDFFFFSLLFFFCFQFHSFKNEHWKSIEKCPNLQPGVVLIGTNFFFFLYLVFFPI